MNTPEILYTINVHVRTLNSKLPRMVESSTTSMISVSLGEATLFFWERADFMRFAADVATYASQLGAKYAPAGVPCRVHASLNCADCQAGMNDGVPI